MSISPLGQVTPSPERSPLRNDRLTDAPPAVGAFWSMLGRNRLLIFMSIVLTVAAAGYYTLQQPAVFDATTSIRIQDREPNLPDIYRALPTSEKNTIGTEIGVLNSRALKEDAATSLALQVSVTEPVRVARAILLKEISVERDAQAADYRLVRRRDGRFDVFLADSTRVLAVSDSSGRVQLPGASFTLTPAAAHYDQLTIQVQSLADAVNRLYAMSVSQPDRDANIVTLSYSDPDSLIVRQVPNAIAAGYLARRQVSASSDAENTAQFLREQLRRVSAELDRAEESFRGYREQARILDPEVQTSSEVSRLISKEAERTALDAERQALSKSLAEIDTTRTAANGPSPYRRLMGLPFLLRNEATSALLNALVTAENEKAALVSATPQDPDMRVLQAKISALEEQLRSITQTYLQGLSNQVASLDAALDAYGRELNSLPRKQLEYARRDRNVKNLESVYTLLQTRLNEAEIAVAARDASIQVVDSATTPTEPSSPQPLINLAAGLAAGLMLGVGVAFVREYHDKSVHSRQDVVVATGVPVLALIPRIPKARGRIALITGRRALGSGRPNHRNGRSRPGAGRVYTFLGSPDAEPVPVVVDGQSLMPSSLELTTAGWTSMVAEAYSLLVTNLAFARDTPTKVVVITSPLAEDGKTTCAVNLAITLALRGSKTLLVDADLRRGVIHTALGSPRAPGLAEVLSRSRSLGEALRTIKVGDHGGTLYYITAGTELSNASALLDSDEFRDLVRTMKADFDNVIIDSPPANIISDASILGQAADGVLVVARSGVTEAAALAFAVEQLNRVSVPLLGVVLNDIDFKRDAGYDSSYRAYSANSQYLSAAPES